MDFHASVMIVCHVMYHCSSVLLAQTYPMMMKQLHHSLASAHMLPLTVHCNNWLNCAAEIVAVECTKLAQNLMTICFK